MKSERRFRRSLHHGNERRLFFGRFRVGGLVKVVRDGGEVRVAQFKCGDVARAQVERLVALPSFHPDSPRAAAHLGLRHHFRRQLLEPFLVIAAPLWKMAVERAGHVDFDPVIDGRFANIGADGLDHDAVLLQMADDERGTDYAGSFAGEDVAALPGPNVAIYRESECSVVTLPARVDEHARNFEART